MNIYVTTTAFSENSLTRTRERDLPFKRDLLDLCIERILEIDSLDLRGIITPIRLNNKHNLTEYNGIPVQSVQTTISSDDSDYNRCLKITRMAENHHGYNLGDTALKWPEGTAIRSKVFYEDNEHVVLFINMDIETPCIVVDGDCIINKCDHSKFTKSMLVKDTSFTYIHDKKDVSRILYARKYKEAGNEFAKNRDVLDFLHFDELKDSLLRKFGLKVVVNKDDQI